VPGSRVEQVRVPTGAAGQRVDNFLLAALKGVPRSLVYRILRSGEVRVNGGRVRPGHRLAGGDQVRIPPLRRPAVAVPAKPSQQLTEALDAAILFEDGHLLVIDKPAGLAVHGGSGLRLGLIEALRAMRPNAELELVHRLDRDTSGCLLIGKRRSALRALHAQLRDGAIDKRYKALLCGPLAESRVRCRAPLLKGQARGGERIVRVDSDAGKPAETWFRRRRTFGDLTLADITLLTGRTHQIRVHAAHLGAPVAGDEKYGDADINGRLRTLGLRRLFLHAASVRFRPRPDAEPIVVEAPLPDALRTVVDALECTTRSTGSVGE
jgi:23S rRNA pseudouridine955/2504/2580 synthase